MKQLDRSKCMPLVALLLAGPSLAEEQPPAKGTVLRITAPAAHLDGFVGNLVAADENTITLARGSQHIRVPREQVTKSESLVGRRGHGLLGVLLGAATGTAIGAALRCTTDEPRGCFPVPGGTSCIVGGSITTCNNGRVTLGALGGAAGGALIGSQIKTDRWGDTPMERVRVTVAPARDRGAQVLVSIEF